MVADWSTLDKTKALGIVVRSGVGGPTKLVNALPLCTYNRNCVVDARGQGVVEPGGRAHDVSGPRLVMPMVSCSPAVFDAEGAAIALVPIAVAESRPAKITRSVSRRSSRTGAFNVSTPLHRYVTATLSLADGTASHDACQNMRPNDGRGLASKA